MHLLLLRSLLQEMIGDLSGPEFPAGEPEGTVSMGYLIVVARNEPALYEHLRNRHRADARVRVVVDRRGAGDVEPGDGPPPAERRRRRSWLSTGASHELVTVTREETIEALNPRQERSIRPEEAPRQMSEMETPEDPQRVTRWLAESQHVLGRVIPALLEDRAGLRRALEAAEREGERLRTELDELRRKLDGLHGERAVMAEAFGGVVDLLGQLQQPLGEIARRLQAAQPATADTRAI